MSEEFKEGDKVKVEVDLKMRHATIVKVNARTLVVRLSNGDQIKRHLGKHRIEKGGLI